MTRCLPGAIHQTVLHLQIEPVGDLVLRVAGQLHHVEDIQALIQPLGDRRLAKVVERTVLYVGFRQNLVINGIEDAPTGRNNPNNTGPVATCEKLIIGKGGKDELASVGWNGLIDDVRIYDRTLTDGEILWLSGETEPRPKPF